MERAHKIKIRAERKEDIGGGDLVHLDDNSSAMRYLRHRYQHIVIDEAQDLSPAHWKMLRAMVASGDGDLFIASDTHQRIYDRQVTLSTVGVHIRGRASKLTLSYRTTQEILDQAAKVVRGATYDDLDDGTDTLDGYHSLLHGPTPVRRLRRLDRRDHPARRNPQAVARGHCPAHRGRHRTRPERHHRRLCHRRRDGRPRCHRPGDEARHHHGHPHQGRPTGRRRSPHRNDAPVQGT
ncbi:UvrD-helicase domain-containing protein [Streptomyces sp. M10(2022)]